MSVPSIVQAKSSTHLRQLSTLTAFFMACGYRNGLRNQVAPTQSFVVEPKVHCSNLQLMQPFSHPAGKVMQPEPCGEG